MQWVRTFRGGEYDRTKTYLQRDVDSVPRAIDALRVMKPYTFMKRDESDIFENPATSRRPVSPRRWAATAPPPVIARDVP